MKQLPGGRQNLNVLNNQKSTVCYMSTLKRNIFSNLVGGGWIALLTLIITPFQVNLLGVEAFGLIGFIATLQIMVSVLDLGLSSTITRELAGDTSPARVSSRPLIRTALSFYWGMALVIGVILATFSGLIARAWFTTNTVDIAVLEQGLQVIAIMLALRWPVSLYSGALAGIQRMDILNIVKASVITLRLVGGIIVILVLRDLSLFLIWTAFSALVEVLVFQTVCRKVMPEMDWRPGFSISAILAVWVFSLSMNGLGLVAMGITQLDRLLISKMLSLESLGYYILAYTAATAISMVLSALNAALMPSFAAAHAANEQEALVQRYDKACRVTLFATGLVLFILVFFGRPLLEIWVNPVVAENAWRPLAILAVGFWLSASVSSAYNIGVACRYPGPLLKVSAFSAVIYMPVLYGLITGWGIEGAAVAWLLLNAGYIVVIVPIVHRNILKIPVIPWLVGILLPFAVLGIITFGGARLITNYLSLTLGFELAIIVPAVIAYMGLGYFILGKAVRSDVIRMIQRVIRTKEGIL